MFILDVAGPLDPIEKALASPDIMLMICIGAALVLAAVVIILLICRKRK